MRTLLALGIAALLAGCARYHFVRPVEVTYRQAFVLRDPATLGYLLSTIPQDEPFSLELTDTAMGPLRWTMDSLGLDRIEVRGVGTYDLDQRTFSDQPPFAVVLHHPPTRRRHPREELTVFRGGAPLSKDVLSYLRQNGHWAVNDTVFIRFGGR
ncbi:MAG: hypothetical protein IPJ76_17475 [Flavobacteriales bacterium]|nr:MAG: hypothetical protein IPJ76_17475 [Flavobacteriales bacterium]